MCIVDELASKDISDIYWSSSNQGSPISNHYLATLYVNYPEIILYEILKIKGKVFNVLN
jgi:hypothetical protein